MRKSRGFSLVGAIFLLVVVATLGAYMVTIGGAQQQSTVLSLLGNRALSAAESGMQWAIADVLANDACFGAATFSVQGGAGSAYAVSVNCTQDTYTEGAAYNLFRLSVTASRGSPGSPDYVERTLRAKVTAGP